LDTSQKQNKEQSKKQNKKQNKILKQKTKRRQTKQEIKGSIDQTGGEPYNTSYVNKHYFVWAYWNVMLFTWRCFE
jgi:hypothetical protein